MASLHFRANVAAIVVNADGQIMAFERGDLPGEWQLPQGGIDEGETPVEAAWRELEEETGLGSKEVELVDEFPEWTAYTYPAGVRNNGRLGQAQRWFTFRVSDKDVEPRPDGVEFTDWKWVTREWMVDNAVDFRQSSYRSVLLADTT
jgi:putative (di)nucleoside polyphosphate hydrolase